MRLRASIALLVFLGVVSGFAAGKSISTDAAVSLAFTPPDRSLYPAGAYVYDRHCAVCHGVRGDGEGEMAATLTVKPRAFRSGTFKYRSTPWGKLPTTDDLIRTVQRGLPGTAMGAFHRLTKAEVRAVAEYVKSFSRKWHQPQHHALPLTVPAEPAWFREPPLLLKHADAGRKVFAQTCAVCHGDKADGRGPAVAGLRDQWGQPAPPADLRQPQLRSGHTPNDIYRVLTTGLNGTPMVSFAEALTDTQKWDVIAYLEMLRGQHAP